MTSNAAIDLAYNPALTIPDAAALLASLAQASAEVLARVQPQTLRYGEEPDAYLDIYRPITDDRADAPVHLFIHGGFWRAFTAKDYAFVAPPLQAVGVMTAVLNYRLCPAVTIEQIVEQARAAVVCLWRRAESLGGDPGRLTVSGHSAGGQLTAMLAATDWAALGLPGDVIKAACPISGLFDIAPLAQSWLQPLLNITPAIARSCSPILHLPSGGRPMALCIGGEESEAFQMQTRAYAEALEAAGQPCRVHLIPGRNHIDIMREFIDGGPLADLIVDLARRS